MLQRKQTANVKCSFIHICSFIRHTNVSRCHIPIFKNIISIFPDTVWTSTKAIPLSSTNHSTHNTRNNGLKAIHNGIMKKKRMCKVQYHKTEQVLF